MATEKITAPNKDNPESLVSSLDLFARKQEKLNKNAHAFYRLDKRIIYIRESIFERACQGKGRDRFTIAHEIAHAMLLDEAKINFNRSSGKLPCYKDPEWQANCLAGELLIPYELCKDMSVDEIVKKCGVSYEAARYQKSHF